MARRVADETLDSLAADDPSAQASRRDLQRIHRVMGTRRIVSRALRGWGRSARSGTALRLLELGAGDGRLMLGVARDLAPHWPRVELTLLDRRCLVDPPTLAAYAALGWTATPAVRDVFDWVADPPTRRWDAVLANLFLHHFEGPALAALLGAIAARSDRCFACEPRRSRLALAASHLVGALGANAVTREDAVLSVHAGFTAGELTAFWPASDPAWRLAEYPAGAFSHCLHAERAARP